MNTQSSTPYSALCWSEDENGQNLVRMLISNLFLGLYRVSSFNDKINVTDHVHLTKEKTDIGI